MEFIIFLMDLFLHIAFIGIVIPLIFFTYGLYLQKKVIKYEVSKVIFDALKPYIPVIASNYAKVNVESYTAMTINESNKEKEKIRMWAYIILGILCGSSILIFLFLSFMNGYIPLNIIFSNIVLVIFVVITEIAFFTFIAAKYRPIDIDKIKEKLVEPFNPKERC